jgi:hypothetical protein
MSGQRDNWWLQDRAGWAASRATGQRAELLEFRPFRQAAVRDFAETDLPSRRLPPTLCGNGIALTS